MGGSPVSLPSPPLPSSCMTSSPHPGGLIHRPGVGAIWQTARWPSNQWLLLSHSENHTSPQVSQVVIFVAEWQSKKMDPRFPVGQARLETLGVLLCALIMALASCQVWNCVELILLGVNPPGSPPLLSASRRASLRPHHGGRLRPGVEIVWTLSGQVCESPSFPFPMLTPALRPPHGACLRPARWVLFPTPYVNP